MTNHKQSLDINAINYNDGIALMSDGSCCPITDWFDSHGELCSIKDNPISGVAGPDTNNQWHSFSVDAFVKVRTH